MKNGRDWVDYTNLALNLATNANLEQLRREQKAANQILTDAATALAEGEEMRVSEAKLQKTLRNSIWRSSQMLEEVEKTFGEQPIQMAVQLHLITPTFSAELCDSWEDKQKLKELSQQLQAKKGEVKAKIGTEKFRQSEKCCEGIRELGWLNRYLLFSRVSEEHEKLEERAKEEIDNLKRQIPSNLACLFNRKKAEVKTDLESRIRKLEREIASDWMEKLLPNPDKDDDTEKLWAEWEELEERLLSSPAGECEDLEAYRAELLRAMKDCLGLNSEEEAEAVAKKLG